MFNTPVCFCWINYMRYLKPLKNFDLDQTTYHKRKVGLKYRFILKNRV